jgi:hypothetical protein
MGNAGEKGVREIQGGGGLAMPIRLTNRMQQYLVSRAKRRVARLRFTHNDDVLTKCQRKAVRAFVRQMLSKQEQCSAKTPGELLVELSEFVQRRNK